MLGEISVRLEKLVQFVTLEDKRKVTVQIDERAGCGTVDDGLRSKKKKTSVASEIGWETMQPCSRSSGLCIGKNAALLRYQWRSF